MKRVSFSICLLAFLLIIINPASNALAANSDLPIIAGGKSHSAFLVGYLAQQGTVWTCGDNTYGQLGRQTRRPGTEIAAPVQGLPQQIVAVATGRYHSVALQANGMVWTWGCNDRGQLGDGTSESRHIPRPVPGLTNIIAISAGTAHTLALRSDGTVWAWGANTFGQLGDGTRQDRYKPVQCWGLTGITKIAAGDAHSIALESDGTVWCWGANSFGQLGNSTLEAQPVPQQHPTLYDVKDIAAGNSHSLAVTADGVVWAWGYNQGRLLGTNTRSEIVTEPRRVWRVRRVAQVAAGDNFSLALKRDGTVWAWGQNFSGQLGDGTTEDRAMPARIEALQNIVSLTAGENHCLAVDQEGQIWAWGDNGGRQLSTITRGKANVYRVTGIPMLLDAEPPAFALTASELPYTIDACYSARLPLNEPAKPGSSFEDIELIGPDGPVEMSAKLNRDSLLITPKKGLHFNTVYTLNLPFDAIRDISGNWMNQCSLKLITKEYVPVQRVTVSREKASLVIGHSGPLQLQASIEPDNASQRRIIWKSMNPTVATVDQGIVYPVGPGTTRIQAIAKDQGQTAACQVTVFHLDSNKVVWSEDQVLGPQGPQAFAGVYHFDDLVIEDNVEITSRGISQLILKVDGVLYLGQNAVIRVRNGYYPGPPKHPISSLTGHEIQQAMSNGYPLLPGVYGRGGDGGRGADGTPGHGKWYYNKDGTKRDFIGGIGGDGGGGGAGGFGGGKGAPGGNGAGGTYVTSAGEKCDGKSGKPGADFGGPGGNSPTTMGGRGGGATDVGENARVVNNPPTGMAGAGGGGNGGAGGNGTLSFIDDGDGWGGGGGGAGGYGGGVLVIMAEHIVFDPEHPPRFLVLGQKGGAGGTPDGAAGEDGEGGLLIIQCPDYEPNPRHWSLGNATYGVHKVPSGNGGHGIVTGYPQKVMINGIEFNPGLNEY